MRQLVFLVHNGGKPNFHSKIKEIKTKLDVMVKNMFLYSYRDITMYFVGNTSLKHIEIGFFVILRSPATT